MTLLIVRGHLVVGQVLNVRYTCLNSQVYTANIPWHFPKILWCKHQVGNKVKAYSVNMANVIHLYLHTII